MSECREELRAAGKPYPRTCPTCGLGKCPKALNECQQKLNVNQAAHEIPKFENGKLVGWEPVINLKGEPSLADFVMVCDATHYSDNTDLLYTKALLAGIGIDPELTTRNGCYVLTLADLVELVNATREPWQAKVAELERALNKTSELWAKQHVKLVEQEQRIVELEDELETERIRLAVCGVLALSNTPASADENRIMDEKYWSGSAQDVAAAVDREMNFRIEVEYYKDLTERLKKQLADKENGNGSL